MVVQLIQSYQRELNYYLERECFVGLTLITSLISLTILMCSPLSPVVLRGVSCVLFKSPLFLSLYSLILHSSIITVSSERWLCFVQFVDHFFCGLTWLT